MDTYVPTEEAKRDAALISYSMYMAEKITGKHEQISIDTFINNIGTRRTIEAFAILSACNIIPRATEIVDWKVSLTDFGRAELKRLLEVVEDETPLLELFSQN